MDDSKAGSLTDPSRVDKVQSAIKSIKTLANIAGRLYANYYDNLGTAKKSSSQSRSYGSEADSDFDLFDHLKLFSGTLMPFQKRGVAWLANMFHGSINGILADEMGLGKTVQMIAFICYLIEKSEMKGGVKVVIVVPVSVLPNWVNEFKAFAPKIPVKGLHSNADERKRLIREYQRASHTILDKTMKPIIITSYETLKKEVRFFQSQEWDYLIIDEGHRIKNANAEVTQKMRTIKFKNCFLLTGTPLQNDLQELWSLLYFLFPKIFAKHEDFKWLLNATDISENARITESKQIKSGVTSLHKVLEPFMLRRIKTDVLHNMVPKKEVDVYCGLSETQKYLYNTLKRRLKSVKVEDTVTITDSTKKRKCTLKPPDFTYNVHHFENSSKTKKIRLDPSIENKKPNNGDIMYIERSNGEASFLRMKQVVDHPYLLRLPVTLDKIPILDERVITESGKMVVLDKMLKKLKQQGHRVLIFSMTVMMLDLIEDFMEHRHFSYRRLDGSTLTEIRQENIEEFNRNKSIFAFLLSTKAGGLGINLTGADTVIFYDRSWNPQLDVQAQDRCHRIGQTKPVMVFTLVAKNTVDERIIDRATAKRKLGKIVIKNEQTANETYISLQQMLHDDSKHIDIDRDVTDEMIDNLLDRSELEQIMNERRGKERRTLKSPKL